MGRKTKCTDGKFQKLKYPYGEKACSKVKEKKKKRLKYI